MRIDEIHFTDPAKRITPKVFAFLEQIAPHVGITIVKNKKAQQVTFSGLGIGEPVTISLEDYKYRLLAEVCGLYANTAIVFGFWEPCEVTLMATPMQILENRAAQEIEATRG
jgi:hypothetical protein